MGDRFDKKVLSQIGLLTGLGAVLPAVGTAEASPVCTIFPCAFTVTSSPAEVNDPGTSTNNDPQSTTVTFNQFDPSLGTLTEIDFSLTSTLFGSISVSAIGPASEGADITITHGQTTWDASYTLALPGSIGFSGSQSDSVFCNSDVGFCSNSKNPSFDVTWSDTETLQSILNQYTGLGTLDATFDLNLVLQEAKGFGSFSASGGGSATWDPARVDGLTVTYIFTPNSTVPEPGTLALVGMSAMAALGFARRRLKSDG